MSIDPLFKYPDLPTKSVSPVATTSAGPPSETEDELFVRLELEYSQRWRPPHVYYYEDWLRQKERYDTLRTEYLSILERWPWWAAKLTNVEQQMEATREAIKLVSTHAKRYERRMRTRKAAGLPMDDPLIPVSLEEAQRLAKEATKHAQTKPSTSPSS